MPRFGGQFWVTTNPDQKQWGVVDILPDRILVFIRGQVVGDWPKADVQIREVGSGFEIVAQGESLGFSTKEASAFRAAAVTGLAARFEMAAVTGPKPSGAPQTGKKFGAWLGGQS